MSVQSILSRPGWRELGKSDNDGYCSGAGPYTFYAYRNVESLYLVALPDGGYVVGGEASDAGQDYTTGEDYNTEIYASPDAIIEQIEGSV